MALPLSIQIITAFLGEDQGSNVMLLPEAFSSGGSKNVYHDKLGRLKKISGYAQEGVVSGWSGQARSLAQLAAYDDQASQCPIYLVHLYDGSTYRGVTAEDELMGTSTSPTRWTSRYSSFVDTSVHPPADSAQWGTNVLYNASLQGANDKMSVSAGTITYADLTATQSPTVSVSEGSAGKLNGTYQWKLVSIHGTTGARKAASVASAVLTTTDKQASLTWTADADTNQGGYELYRTTGTGKYFYFVTYIDGRATAAYTDNIPDTEIFQNRVMEEHGDVPPDSYYVEGHKGRLWWAGPTKVYWSDAGLPESVFAQNYLTFADTEVQGDTITGLIGSFNDSLIVFTRRAVWRVTGSGQIVGYIADWTNKRTNARTGSVTAKSAVRVHEGASYLGTDGTRQTVTSASLAYLTPLNDIRLFNGDTDLVISHPVKDTLDTINTAYAYKSHGVADPARSQFIWWVPTGTSTTPNTAIVWNHFWGTWNVWTDQYIGASTVVTEYSGADSVILASSQDGAVVKLLRHWSGDTLDGRAIPAVWISKPLFGSDEQGVPLLSSTKRWRWADFRFTGVDPDVSFVIEWMDAKAGDNDPGIGSVTVSPATASITTADGSAIVTASGSTVVMGRTDLQVKVRLEDRTNDYLHAEGIRLRVKETSGSGSWCLEAINLAYQTLPGQKRRMDS